MNFADFSDNMLALSLVFLNVVTPVFILVAVGFFIGPLLKIAARPLSRIAYFVFVPAFVFNIISEAKIVAGIRAISPNLNSISGSPKFPTFPNVAIRTNAAVISLD